MLNFRRHELNKNSLQVVPDYRCKIKVSLDDTVKDRKRKIEEY